MFSLQMFFEIHELCKVHKHYAIWKRQMRIVLVQSATSKVWERYHFEKRRFDKLVPQLKGSCENKTPTMDTESLCNVWIILKRRSEHADSSDRLVLQQRRLVGYTLRAQVLDVGLSATEF